VFEETEINTNRDLDTWTTNYGIGGGLMIEVYRSALSDEDEGGLDADGTICIDLGARYLIGGRADYAKTDTVDQDGVFDTTSSRTDMVTVHLGVSFQIF
jgi:hypothetical protein